MYTNYIDKSKEEMDLLLSNFHQLTIDAKRNLLNYLQGHENIDFADFDLTKLEASILKEEAEINDLKYLKNLGFALNDENGHLTMKRTNQARKMDVFTLVFGLILLVLLPLGIYGIYWSYTKVDFELGAILTYVIVTAVGIVGLLLALRAAERIDKYWSLLLVVQDQMIVLSKKGVVLDKISSEDDLSLSENAESIASYLNGNSGSHELIKIDRPNLYFSQTLHQLKKIITKRLHQCNNILA